jgi:heme exporter protein D
MTNAQLWIAVGIPAFTMLITLLGSIWQSTNVLNQISFRIGAIEGRMGALEQDMKMIVRVVNDLDNRLSRLEERLAH